MIKDDSGTGIPNIMVRAILFLAAFTLISPSLRDMISKVLGYAQTQMQLHSTITFASIGLLCFCSVLWIRLSSRQ